MLNYDEEFETEAIEKCSRSLKKLDDRAKLRVIKYLLDRFNLIARTEPESKEVVNQNIHYQQNNLVLAEPKAGAGHSMQISEIGSFSPKDIWIKGYAKTEPELLIVICFQISKMATNTFSRQEVVDGYRDHQLMSDARLKNLSGNLTSLIKKSYLTTVAEDELALSPEGVKYVSEIINGTSTTKKRKPRSKKSSANKEQSANGVAHQNTEVDGQV